MNADHEARQPAIRDEDGNRHRTALAPVRKVPRKQRRAEVVCRRDSGRPPHLLAVVYPRGASLDALRVNNGQHSIGLGADFTAICPCGHRHAVNGGKLRSAVAAGSPDRLLVLGVSDLTTG